MATYGANKRYLQLIAKQLTKIPAAAASEIAARTFLYASEETPQDSGQAAINWRIEPFTGTFTPQEFEMMWGNKDTTPTPPVGNKRDEGENREAVMAYQYNEAADVINMYPNLKFDGIIVYNPLSAGIPNFYPGTPEYYERNSIGKVSLSDIIERGKAGGYAAVQRDFDMVAK